ncbi:MAG TPA: hypothetical protein VEB59_10345 [Gemmatimonadales bacterium]|nr:hypothetical protein [Gemmatimonadales bacterium]
MAGFGPIHMPSPQELLMLKLTPAFLVITAVALSGCSEESSHPGGPDVPAGPDPSAHAFLLTIDVASGKVDVQAPRNRAAGDGPSLSLLGRDVIGMQASSCTFSPVPNKPKLKRCSLELTISNRLAEIALVTPTFPTPPSGVTGVLVFPYTAGATTVTGTTAVANTEWDNAPMNFFNDFGKCPGGQTSDCYRSESFPILLGGETSRPRVVGFDVDKAAQSVTTFVLVAADLGRQTALAPIDDRCGTITELDTQMGTDYSLDAPGSLIVGSTDGQPAEDYLGLCGFDLTSVPVGARVLGASFRATQRSGSATLFAEGNTVVLEQVFLGTELDEADWNASTIRGLGSLSTNATLERKRLDVSAAVLDDIGNGRTRSDFRLRLDPSGIGTVRFDGPEDTEPPELVVAYTD